LEGIRVERARKVLGESRRGGRFIAETLNGFGEKVIAAIALGKSVEEFVHAGFGYKNLVEALQPCYAKGNYKGSLRAASRELMDMSKHQYVPPFLPAFLFASLGDAEQAVAWLERAYKEHNWVLLDLKNDPIWDPIRSDRRFKGLLRRVGLAS
jgi:hypothetical protein